MSAWPLPALRLVSTVVVCLRADPGAQPPQLQPLCGCDAARGRGRERAPMPTDDD